MSKFNNGPCLSHPQHLIQLLARINTTPGNEEGLIEYSPLGPLPQRLPAQGDFSAATAPPLLPHPTPPPIPL